MEFNCENQVLLSHKLDCGFVACKYKWLEYICILSEREKGRDQERERGKEIDREKSGKKEMYGERNVAEKNYWVVLSHSFQLSLLYDFLNLSPRRTNS